MDCITEGFRKCGIFPFNPYAVDKRLLLRSCTDVDPNSIDLEVPTTETFTDQEVQVTKPDTAVQKECSLSSIESSKIDDTLFDVSFTLGDDGILTLQQTSVSQQSLSDTQPIENSATDCPPELGLAAMECTLTPRKNASLSSVITTASTYKILCFKHCVTLRARWKAKQQVQVIL
ncbi:hypothetical protein DPMN_091012 [Dreissena polymorpha]|uniref:Uncharacterized protein n=1 Tax=Dreissena polymorpha TaxID=45954 RepID=A0A9D4KYS1_DREPO|nr:hypothetical protein DPMN_091012 [Dreissena polymorpha]